jgi:FemAB-related protein (PEP-CTERM system-associated)
MQIRLATETDRTAWDDYVLRHPEGTAYQLFAWQEAVSRAYRFRGDYLLAEKGGVLCGILPLIDFRVPFARRLLISLPYCDVGGVLADNKAIALAMLTSARSLAEKHGADLQLRAVRALPDAGINQTDKVRMLLDLPENAGQLMASLEAKVRSQVKKPVRDGLTAQLGTHELIDDFYLVFSENMRDLGSPVHSRQWIEAIVSAYDDRVRVAVIYTPDGKPAAAGIVLIHPATMSIPWASSLRRYNRLNPNMLLYWTFLALAIDRGCRCFDFGRSTPGGGTYHFKEQWGARPVALFWQSSAYLGKPVRQGGSSSTLRDFAEQLWRRMPLAVCNILGPKARRCINL